MQRPQSIYLALAAVLMGLCIVFPYATADQSLAAAAPSIYADGKLDYQDNMALLVLPIVSALLAIAAIFSTSIKYKPSLYNWQRRLCYFAVALALGTVAMAFYLFMNDTISGTVGIAIILPVIATIFLLLTSRATTKDENIIRSSNRLR